MTPKFDLKPQSSERITLFANKAEAIVFWLAAAGLIFLAIVSLFRYLTYKELQPGEQFQKEIVLKTEQLENQNQMLRNQIDSLRTEIERLEVDLRKE